MNRTLLTWLPASLAMLAVVLFVVSVSAAAEPLGEERGNLRLGIIGLDTSHVIAFTQLLNSEEPPEEIRGCRIVAAYPYGSRDIESSYSRIPLYTQKVQQAGVEIVESIDDLIEKVDAVFLETNDGRPHLEQVLPLLKASKPTFVDKPIAASLTDAIAIFEAAEHYKTPLFSASSLRYGKGTQSVRSGSIGRVFGCDIYSPCDLEATHPDLFWYGIHGVESLFTVMGTGCDTVQRMHTTGTDVVVGKWKDGRIGTFRGIREGHRDYGGMAFGEKGNQVVGHKAGYEPLLLDAIRFFRSGTSSVSKMETIEIYAFMQAAEESKKQGGVPVSMDSVMRKAKSEAVKKRTW